MPEGRGALVVVPLPISSPALGSGIVPVLAYIFPLGGTDPFYSKDFGKLGWEYAKALVKQLKRDKVICNE